MNQYKYETAEICKRNGWDKVSLERVFLLYVEECGELASAIRHHMKYCMKTNTSKNNGLDVVLEMGDVFSYLFQLSYMLGIDLDEMWSLHKNKVKKKMYVYNNGFKSTKE
jgi:NTP pyrophosphatase (non-canonical NTP hydrolase)